MEDAVNSDGHRAGEAGTGLSSEATALPGESRPGSTSSALADAATAGESERAADADVAQEERAGPVSADESGEAADALGSETLGAADDEPPRPSPDVRSLVHKHFVAPALIPLDRVDADDLFRLRAAAPDEDDVSALATDIARLGQLFPIDVRLKAPDRFQVITGFRRVAALKMLQREKVLARLHTDLADDDALLMALASAIHGKALAREELEAARERLSTEGRLSPAARDMLQRALSEEDGLAPAEVEEEVDADELASDVTLRLSQCNQDLSLLADVFGELDPARREELLTQLRYSADLVAFLEGRFGSEGKR
jgi:hypothetical protein